MFYVGISNILIVGVGELDFFLLMILAMNVFKAFSL